MRLVYLSPASLCFLFIVCPTHNHHVTQASEDLGLFVGAHRRSQDDQAAGVSVLLVEGQHLGQGELRAHVRVQDEEGLGAARQDLVSEVVQAPAGAQRGVLLQVPDTQRGDNTSGVG